MAKRRRFTAEFKAKVVLEALSGESSQAELCRKPHNLSEDQLSKWKQFVENAASLFESRDKASEDAAERIAHLEHLVGKLTVALDIEKGLDLVELTPSEKRNLIEALRDDYSVHQISKTLGFNRSLLYYHPKSDPSEAVLEDEIEQLCARYPTYGYRRITQLLANEGYTVGYRRVARLMKEQNLSVSVKRVSSQTTRSLEGAKPWVNRVEALDICRCDQVWVGDITYVRLKGRFIYVAVLMDVFSRMIRGWQVSRHLNTSLTLSSLEQALRYSVPEIHHSDQGVQYLSSAYISILTHHGIEISLAHRGRPWENGYAERLIRTLKEEEVHLNDYEDITEVRARIGHFITQVYNHKRPHSALGYLTPVEFQRKNLS